MKVAIVCDFLTKFGGAQRVLLDMHKAFPDAPIHTLLYDEEGTKKQFTDCRIIQSKLSRLPGFIRRRPKFLLPFFAQAIESFDFSGYDIVISSSDSFAHGVITKPSTFHLCYCHTPMRYAWDWYNEYLKENHVGMGLKGLIIRSIIHKIRIWDRIAAHRVDQWAANSKNVTGRIRKYYQDDSIVIYPPVDVEKIKPSAQNGGYYIIVSRLEPYKRVGLAVEAFNKLGLKLKIIGEGSELTSLKSMAKDNIEFLGWRSDSEMHALLEKSKAFVFPGEDDFGITPVEAMAAGKPVIAFKKGGTLETVIESKTGLFFEDETADSLEKAVRKLEADYDKFDYKTIRQHAENFSEARFIKEIKDAALNGYKLHLEKMANGKKN